MTVDAYLVLANAGAGTTAEAAVGAAVARLAEHAPVQLRWTEEPEEFCETVRDAPADTQVVVAGGDGSIHLALDTFDAAGLLDRPVGIVPLGTGNDFARNRAIPLDPSDAADVIVAGAHRVLPFIEMTTGGDRHLVANNVHFGLGVDAARRAQSLKPMTGRLAYPLATAFEGVTGEARHVEVHGDGEVVWSGPALAVLALLGPSMGGGVEVVDAEAPAIDLVVVGPAGLRERIEVVRAVRNGSIDDHPAVSRRTVSHAQVVTADPIADSDVDGELMELTSPVDLRHVDDGWRVLLPAD